MQIGWTIAPRDTEACTQFMQSYANHWLVLDRKERNVRRKNLNIDRSTVWRSFVGCLLTTQQKSGEGSAVMRFLDSDASLLDVDHCKKQKDLTKYASSTLSKYGLRRGNIIASEIEYGIGNFFGSSWKDLKSQLSTIETYPTLKKEREVTTLLQDRFKGLGPKQSRNLVQWIGLSRYVIPLDSRFAKHLNGLSFPIEVSATLLANEHAYRLVEDGIQALMGTTTEYPCVYDASVFASFETEA